MRRRFTVLAMSLVVALVIGGMSTPASAADRSGPARATANVVRLDGAQEPLPADPDGTGVFAYAAFDSRLCYLLTANNIAPATAAHVHAAPPGQSGPVVVALAPPTIGVSGGCIQAVPNTTPNGPNVLLRSELDAIIAQPGAFYVNVHNAPFPAGAIRAQLR